MATLPTRFVYNLNAIPEEIILVNQAWNETLSGTNSLPPNFNVVPYKPKSDIDPAFFEWWNKQQPQPAPQPKRNKWTIINKGKLVI